MSRHYAVLASWFPNFPAIAPLDIAVAGTWCQLETLPGEDIVRATVSAINLALA